MGSYSESFAKATSASCRVPSSSAVGIEGARGSKNQSRSRAVAEDRGGGAVKIAVEGAEQHQPSRSRGKGGGRRRTHGRGFFVLVVLRCEWKGIEWGWRDLRFGSNEST